MENELNSDLSLILAGAMFALAGTQLWVAWTEWRKGKDDDDQDGEGGTPACA